MSLKNSNKLTSIGTSKGLKVNDCWILAGSTTGEPTDNPPLTITVFFLAYLEDEVA